MTNIVHLCDCMDFMRQKPDKFYDVAIVDPPYCLSKESTQGSGKLKKRALNTMDVAWDIAPGGGYFEEIFRVSKNQMIWGGNYFNLPPTRGIAIWDKEQPFENFSAFEYCWTSFDVPAKIFREATTRTGEKKIHPTQKSVRLYSWIINNYIKEGDKILDTHVGSGSIRIACDKAGLYFEGCEINPEFWNAQEKRYLDFKKQLTLF